MTAETFGLLSALLVVLSGIPYSIRVYQGKIETNVTAWSLWSLIGLALLLTYKSSGAKANMWPAVFGFINPCLITLLAVRNHGGWPKPDKWEWRCMIFCFMSLGLWLLVYNQKEYAQFALYLAVVADLCAAIPIVKFVWTEPASDRPLAWILFAIGYGLAFFSIIEHTFANYILPIYMTTTALSIALPLIIYRLRRRASLAEWI